MGWLIVDDDFDPYRKWLGIPPEEQPPHHYRLLGIALFEDDPDVIGNAADRQMAHLRTFQTGKRSAQSQDLLNELSMATVCLLDRGRKALYDEELRESLGSRPTRPTGLASPGPPVAPAMPPRVGVPVAAAVRRFPGTGLATVIEAPDPAAAIVPRPIPVPPDGDLPMGTVRSTSRPIRSRRRPSQAPVVGAVVAVAALVVLGLVLLQTLDRSGQRTSEEQRSTGATAPTPKSNGPAVFPKRGPTKIKREPRSIQPEYPPDHPDRDRDRPDDNSPPSPPPSPPPKDSPFRPRDDEKTPSKTQPDEKRPPKDEPKPDGKPPVAKRPPLPEKKLVDRAVGIVRGEYKQALSDAKTPPARTDLAKELLTKAETAPDAATKVAMLELARQIALQLADVDLLCQSVDMLAAQFDIDLLKVKHDTLKEATALPLRPEQYRKFLPPIKQVVAESMQAECTETALEYARLQKVVAAKLNDAINIRESLNQLRDLTEHDKLLKKFKEFEKASAENAEANLHVGRYLCFIRRDWDVGLARLAKCADPKLAEQAAKDVAKPTDPAKQVDVADGWLQFARRREESVYKLPMQERAKHWYQQALDKLPDAEKKKVEARMAEASGGAAAKS